MKTKKKKFKDPDAPPFAEAERTIRRINNAVKRAEEKLADLRREAEREAKLNREMADWTERWMGL